MSEVSTIGLDIAKSVFQVHGVDGTGAVVMRKRVSRAKLLEFFAGLSPCLVGIEACPSAHYWSRELQALGHTVKLMPPSYVKAYLKRSKNNANDAAAICEAVTRPSMRFVPIKTQEQQTGLMLHRTTIAGPAAHDAIECDPRAYGRARHHLGQGPQWHGRAVTDYWQCRGRSHPAGCPILSRPGGAFRSGRSLAAWSRHRLRAVSRFWLSLLDLRRNFQRREASRSASASVNQGRIDRQPQDRKGARRYHTILAAFVRRRGDRMARVHHASW